MWFAILGSAIFTPQHFFTPGLGFAFLTFEDIRQPNIFVTQNLKKEQLQNPQNPPYLEAGREQQWSLRWACSFSALNRLPF